MGRRNDRRVLRDQSEAGASRRKSHHNPSGGPTQTSLATRQPTKIVVDREGGKLGQPSAPEDAKETAQLRRQLEAYWGDPRRSLADVARGKARLELHSLEGVLAGHVLAADEQVRCVERGLGGFLGCLFGPEESPDGKKLDLHAGLTLASRAMELQRSALGELRKTTELCARLIAPRRPSMSVFAVGNEIRVGDENHVDTIDLGGAG